jgi:hypothetical protein
MINRITSPFTAVLLGLIICISSASLPAEEQTSQYRIIGLFSPDRQKDLRNVMEDVPEMKLVSLDYDNALVTLRYDVKEIVPEFNPKKPLPDIQIEEHLDKLLLKASDGTFGLNPLSSVPKEKQTKLDIDIGILDCKGCRYGAYLAAIKLPGVEQAVVGTDRSVLTAWIDPAKTDRASVEAGLTRARVELKTKAPTTAPAP